MSWLAALLLLAWVLRVSAGEREHRRQLYAQRARFERYLERW